MRQPTSTSPNPLRTSSDLRTDFFNGIGQRLTSAAAVLEAVLGLARPDKFNMSVDAIEPTGQSRIP